MQYRRLFVPGGTYFITLTLKNRKSNLLINEIDKLRYSFKRAKYFHPFKLDGIVVLPDHLHMIMTLPPDDINFSLRIKLIKSIFSHQINSDESITSSRQKKSERGIWQRRFWEHLIRDEKDLENHLNYIHYNPVKHGHTDSPTNWSYSSIHQHIKSGMLSKNWACTQDFNKQAFGE